MVIDLVSTYSMTDADYDKIIQLVAENKTNRNGCEMWADFVGHVRDKKLSSTLAANNHATYINIIKDIRAKKAELSDASKVIRELEAKAISARKALEEAEQEIRRLKSIACNN